MDPPFPGSVFVYRTPIRLPYNSVGKGPLEESHRRLVASNPWEAMGGMDLSVPEPVAGLELT